MTTMAFLTRVLVLIHNIHDHILGFKRHGEVVQSPDELIVASIVDDVDDPGLASSRLGGPCKVASVQPGKKIGNIVSGIGGKIGILKFPELDKRLAL